MSDRSERQRVVYQWGVESFGIEHMASLPQRGLRFLEEAIELYQAVGGDPAMGHKLLDYVFARKVGEIGQEIGGVSLTLLTVAEAAGLDANAEEAREVERVLSKPRKHFTERNKQKNAAGFDVTGAYPIETEKAA